MKQTAVEFIVKQIKKDLNLRLRGFDIDGIGKQAKEMEKEQIIDFANDLLAQNDTNYIAMPDLAEQYYNETFKNK